jgi:hypothetical protein
LDAFHVLAGAADAPPTEKAGCGAVMTRLRGGFVGSAPDTVMAVELSIVAKAIRAGVEIAMTALKEDFRGQITVYTGVQTNDFRIGFPALPRHAGKGGKQGIDNMRCREERAMVKVYLHIREGNHLIRDEEGADFADVAEAKREAEASLHDMLVEDIKNQRPVQHRVIEMTDEAYHILATVEMRPALRTVRDTRAE